MKKKYQQYLASILMDLYQNEIFKSQKICYSLTKMLMVFAAIRKCQNHPSIQNYLDKTQKWETFELLAIY